MLHSSVRRAGWIEGFDAMEEDKNRAAKADEFRAEGQA